MPNAARAVFDSTPAEQQEGPSARALPASRQSARTRESERQQPPHEPGDADHEEQEPNSRVSHAETQRQPERGDGHEMGRECQRGDSGPSQPRIPGIEDSLASRIVDESLRSSEADGENDCQQ